MAAAPLALTAARGEAVTYTCTHQTSGASTTPIDITGWTIKVTARDEDGRSILSKTATITSGPAGTYSFPVTHADTNIQPKAYRLDIQRVDSGSERLMGKGTWTIDSEVLYP